MMNHLDESDKKLNKNLFILLCMIVSLVCAIIVAVLIIPSIGMSICGFVPISLVAFCCAVGQIIGTIYYVSKHKYAYGDNYEWYQIINSAIYGIQNVLRVLLVVLLINICAMPIFVVLMLLYGAYILRKIFK